MKVLLIEDEVEVAKSLLLLFESEGIQCDIATSGEKAVELGKHYSTNYDIIILDLMLPDVNGLDILVKLRTAKIKVPVLILSSLNDLESKVRGLGLGADDYMTKPFHRGELIARMHAITRRSKGHAKSVLQFDKISVDLDNRIVTVDNKAIALTAKEYAILELLAIHAGTVVNKENIVNHLYQGIDVPEGKIVDVFVCKLRRKLYEASGGRNYIDTVWGRGYSLKEPTEMPITKPQENKRELIGA